MKQIILYTKSNCPLCDDAKLILSILNEEENFVLTERDIYKDDELLEKYQLMIPVIEVDGIEVDFGQIDMEKVREAIQN